MYQKKSWVCLLCSFVTILSGCTGTQSNANQSGNVSEAPLELSVITSFSAADGNYQNYHTSVAEFEEKSGYIVRDSSSTANEEWKNKVLVDFQAGADPDVLFFFSGADANSLIQAGKVVSLDRIREEYPQYALNMQEDKMPVSPLDGKTYVVPVLGYWEGMFVNKDILQECGVEMPGSDYTWKQFLIDCQKIRDHGYVPIAASLGEIPHYWFEFCVYNNTTTQQQQQIPQSLNDDAARAWMAGIEDIKELYTRGFFPEDTLTMSDLTAYELVAQNRAAFALDGSWKMGWFSQNIEQIDTFAVTYVPAKGERKATDIIGGTSMGYYITEKAWNNEEKRKAAVQFVEYMTSTEVVSSMSVPGANCLKAELVSAMPLTTQFANSANTMALGANSLSSAVQDNMKNTQRTSLFGNIKYVVTGEMTARDALKQALQLSQ